MEVQNVVDKKKAGYRFAVLYIISIILLALIFTALWNAFSSPVRLASKGNLSNSTSEESVLLRHDELLHAHLKKLQQFDDNYTILLTNSAGRLELDSLNKLIENGETSLSNMIDSIENQKKSFDNQANAASLDTITSAFRSALVNRKSLGYMRIALSGEIANLSSDERELLKSKMELQTKNKAILALENQIKIQSQVIPDNNTLSATEIRLNGEIETLKSDLEKEKEKSSNLVTLNNSLSKDNNQLTVMLTEVKSNVAKSENQERADRSKNDLLQNKISDLNAELIFAKIDCNLTRANASQIISNSRQRRDLLQESLTQLNNLSSSNSVSIQKRVREKLSQLQNIVATVRD